MNRIAKLIFIALAAVVGVIVLALLGINLYLQSGEVQQRIRLAASDAVGFPVEVRRTTYFPWRGLVLSGVSVANPDMESLPLIDAARFCVTFEWLPLIQRNLVISEVSLQNPVFALRQGKDGQWAPERAERAPKPPKPQPLPPDGAVEKPPKDLRPPAYKVELRKVTIRNGSAKLTDSRGRSVVKLDGISLDGSITNGSEFNGDLFIADLGFVDRIFPKKLHSRISFRDEMFSVTEIRTRLAGGNVRGEFFLRTGAPEHQRFEWHTKLDDIDLPRLIGESQGDDSDASGTLNGNLTLKGDPRSVESFTGDGGFTLTSGQLRPFDFLRQIGTLLQIDELQMLKLRRADGRFHISEKKVWIDEVVFQTENLILTAAGPVNFKGKLDLDGRFLVNDKLRENLRGLLTNNFEASENADYRQITFSIGGTLSSPKTNLLDRLTGLRIGDFGGLIRGIFGAGSASEELKSKDDESNQD